jgi:hypothetical protein
MAGETRTARTIKNEQIQRREIPVCLVIKKGLTISREW